MGMGGLWYDDICLLDLGVEVGKSNRKYEVCDSYSIQRIRMDDSYKPIDAQQFR